MPCPPTRLRSLLVLGMFAVAAAASGPAIGEDDTVKLGVRRDAPPFSFANNPPADTGAPAYAGYIVDLCTTALSFAGRDHEFVEVTGQDRFKLLADGDVDMLCEPTTIATDRFDKAAFSQIVFLAGVSYLFVPGAVMEQDLTVGYLSGTTAARIVDGMIAEGVFGRVKTPSRRPFDSHLKGVAAVCKSEIAFYVGDRDILLSLMARHQDCAADASNRFFSYEPYAIAVAPDNTVLLWEIQKGLYKAFARNEVKQIFKTYFGQSQPSALLKHLFIINSIPDPPTRAGRAE